ncbi:MAG: TonB-dependent siderophore receptor [Pseudomonadota bacterium]
MRGATCLSAVGASALIGALLSQDVRAQTVGDEATPIPMEEIVVEDELPEESDDGFVPTRSGTGAKTDTPIVEVPQSISVITRERLDAQGLDSVSDVFRFTPGVIGEAFGNDTRVEFLRFRGFDDSGDAVFRDGLALRSSGFGQFFPELFGVERVEVLRGPSSSLFGLGNPGGLVNLVSKTPTEQFFAEGAVEGGTFGRFGGRFDFGGPVTEENTVSVRFTGLARRSDTQVDFVDNDRGFFAPAVTVRPNDRLSFTALGFVQIDDTGSTNQFLPIEGTVEPNPNGDIGSDTFVGEPGFDDFARQVFSVGYLLEYEVSDALTFKQNLRYNDLLVDSESVFGAGLQADLRTLDRFSFTADAETKGITIDSNLQYDVGFRSVQNRLLVGFDFLRYDFEEEQGFDLAPSIDIFEPVFGAAIAPPPLFLDTDIVQRQFGFYAQDQLTLFDDFIITLSGRYDLVDTTTTNNISGDVVDQDDSAFSGRAGIVYRGPFGISPFFGFTESFAPTAGTDVDGVPFEPSTARQFEGGIRYEPPGTNALIAVTGFNVVQENLLTTDPANPLNEIQTGEVRSRGVEFEASASLEMGVDLNASYTFQDVEITESTEGDVGNRLGQVPKHEFAAFASYRFGTPALRGLTVGGGVRYRSGTTNNANTVDVDGFVLVDAVVNYQWENFNLNVRAENLLGNEHIQTCSSETACFFGSDRRVVARLNYRF